MISGRPESSLTSPKRGAMRTLFDGRYKFTRYFSPMQHNLPRTLNELFEYNDVELYDLKNDPNEMHNLSPKGSEKQGLDT